MNDEPNKKYSCIRDYLGDWCKEMNSTPQGGYGATTRIAPESSASILVPMRTRTGVLEFIDRYYSRLTCTNAPFKLQTIHAAINYRGDSTVILAFRS